MKQFKRFIRITGIILLLLLVFKEWVYNVLFTYESIGTRNHVAFSPPTAQVPKVSTQSEALYMAQEFTHTQLKFSTENTSQQPNAVLKRKNANCIGYAALFTAYYNWIVKENNLESRAEHHIGKIYLFKYNLHQLFNHSFFADHDFVIVSGQKGQERIAIDPSIGDYFGIDRVSIR